MKKKKIKRVLKTIRATCEARTACRTEDARSNFKSYCPFTDDKNGHCILLNVEPERWTKKQINDMAYYISEEMKNEDEINE